METLSQRNEKMRDYISQSVFPPVHYVLNHFYDWDMNDFSLFVSEGHFNSFLAIYYLNLKAEEANKVTEGKESNREAEQVLSRFLNSIPLPIISMLWNQEGCSLSGALLQNLDKKSFISSVSHERKAQILFYIFEELKDSQFLKVEILKTKKTIFTLLFFMPNDFIQTLYEFEFFKDFSEDLESIFTLNEILFFAEKRPELFDKVDLNTKNENLKYLKTLESQTRLEFLEIKDLMLSEFDMEVVSMQKSSLHKSSTVISKRNTIYFRLDYVLQMIKLFRYEKRKSVFALLEKSELKERISTVDLDILSILIQKED